MAWMRGVIRRLFRILDRYVILVRALCLALSDRRTPLCSKLVAICTTAYAASPIDLIPDFIPLVGLLDDLILVSLGIWLAVSALSLMVSIA